MTITKKTDGDTLTVVVDGWLDTMTAPKFQEEVQDLGGAKNVVHNSGFKSDADLVILAATIHPEAPLLRITLIKSIKAMRSLFELYSKSAH